MTDIGLKFWKGFSEYDVASWIKVNFNCSRYIAKQAAKEMFIKINV
jgi:hypothetical protein